eukprot:m.54371 g.54371  ORF g.54371 m.54371 type:complete len:684 (+) comp34354_c0_seq1:98-2149(+)
MEIGKDAERQDSPDGVMLGGGQPSTIAKDENYFARLGLGRGVNGLEPKNLLATVVRPVPMYMQENAAALPTQSEANPNGSYTEDPHVTSKQRLAAWVEENLAATGYSSFISEIYSQSNLTRDLLASLEAEVPTPIAVNFNFGLHYEKSDTLTRHGVAVISQIVNREYRYQLFPPVLSVSDETTEVENFIQKELSRTKVPAVPEKMKEQSQKGPAQAEGASMDVKSSSPSFEMKSRLQGFTPQKSSGKPMTKKERKKYQRELTYSSGVCETVLKRDLHGATHFVSAIKMGGMTYTEESIARASTSDNFGLNLHTGAGDIVKSKVAFTRKAVAEAAKKESVVYLALGSKTRDKLSKHCSDQDENQLLNIPEDDEVVISRNILPISALIRDHDMREAMNKACQRLIDRQLSTKPPLLCRPLLLKVSSELYLTLDETLSVCVTKKRTKATSICIEPVQSKHKRSSSVDQWQKTPNYPFYLAFLKDKQKYYFQMAPVKSSSNATKAQKTAAKATPPDTSRHDKSTQGSIQHRDDERLVPDSGSQSKAGQKEEMTREERVSFLKGLQIRGRLTLSPLMKNSARCRFFLHHPGSGRADQRLLSWSSPLRLCLHVNGFFKRSDYTLEVVHSRLKTARTDLQEVSAYFIDAASQSFNFSEDGDETYINKIYCQYHVANITSEELEVTGELTI